MKRLPEKVMLQQKITRRYSGKERGEIGEGQSIQREQQVPRQGDWKQSDAFRKL